jgi:hypothetical protein
MRVLQGFGACVRMAVTFAIGLVAPSAIVAGLALLPKAAGAVAMLNNFGLVD